MPSHFAIATGPVPGRGTPVKANAVEDMTYDGCLTQPTDCSDMVPGSVVTAELSTKNMAKHR